MRWSAPGSMSRPLTRTLGEPRNRTIAAPSASATSIVSTVTATLSSAASRPTSASVGATFGQSVNPKTSTRTLGRRWVATLLIPCSVPWSEARRATVRAAASARRGSPGETRTAGCAEVLRLDRRLARDVADAGDHVSPHSRASRHADDLRTAHDHLASRRAAMRLTRACACSGTLLEVDRTSRMSLEGGVCTGGSGM